MAAGIVQKRQQGDDYCVKYRLELKTLPQALENMYLIKASALKLSLPWSLLH